MLRQQRKQQSWIVLVCETAQRRAAALTPAEMVGVGSGPGGGAGRLHYLAARGDRKATAQQIVNRENKRTDDTVPSPGRELLARRETLLAVRAYYAAGAAEYNATAYELALRGTANARDLAKLERLVADRREGQGKCR